MSDSPATIIQQAKDIHGRLYASLKEACDTRDKLQFLLKGQEERTKEERQRAQNILTKMDEAKTLLRNHFGFRFGRGLLEYVRAVIDEDQVKANKIQTLEDVLKGVAYNAGVQMATDSIQGAEQSEPSPDSTASAPTPSYIKPPLGLKPRYLALEERLNDVEAAMERYVVAQVDIPHEWLRERLDLISQMKHTPRS